MGRKGMKIIRGLGMAALAAAGGMFLSKKAAGYIAKKITHPLITEKFDKNIWELVTSVQRYTANALIEDELRAEADGFIERPIGGPRKFPFLNKIMFNIAQLETLPTIREVDIDTSVVIGPQSQRPLVIKIPILLAGMSYGLALSEAYKIAFARGATLAGTACNTGLGPFFEAERKAAKRLIIQYPRASWNKDPQIIKQSDAVEIQFGQGANAGTGKTLQANKIDKKLRERMGLKKGQDAVIHNRIEGVASGDDLKSLIAYLKEVTGGVPVGAKIGAGKYIEEDLRIITGAGADFVSVDGAEAGTHSSLPVLEDDFGLPTLIAAARAARFWRENNLKGRVSLLVGGGLFTPGDCLKMLALGADAVYMGTAVLIATTHTQVLKVIPYHPPTQLAYQDGKYKNRFDINRGSQSLARFLAASVYEMEEAVKALGKTSIRQLSREDVFSINRDVAEITGIDLGFHPTPRAGASKY